MNTLNSILVSLFLCATPLVSGASQTDNVFVCSIYSNLYVELASFATAAKDDKAAFDKLVQGLVVTIGPDDKNTISLITVFSRNAWDNRHKVAPVDGGADIFQTCLEKLPKVNIAFSIIRSDVKDT